jgi:hypothetical protein
MTLRIRNAVPDDAPRIFVEPEARRHDAALGFTGALGAIEEPVIAHAVIFEEFERLAAEATRG